MRYTIFLIRYFASIQVEYPDGSTEVYMNPDDFVRSIIPNEMQPKHVDLDHFHKVKWDSQTLKQLSAAKSTKSTRFFHTLSTQSNGLISLSEYIFLLTILMVPKRKLELIFKAMDLSGDNLIEFDEFASHFTLWKWSRSTCFGCISFGIMDRTKSSGFM